MLLKLRSLFMSAPAPTEEPVPHFTKDWQQLQHSPGWTFFEYGELKKGMPRHEHLNCVPRSHAYTVHTCPLWMMNDRQDAFPIAAHIHPELGTRRSHIQGELYQLPTETIPHLDAYRQNGVQFNRKRITVMLPSGVEIKAFAYVGNKKFWDPMFDWERDFYRGRGESAFSLIHPKPVGNTTFWSSNFTKNQLTEKRLSKCFMGLYANGLSTDRDAPRQQAA